MKVFFRTHITMFNLQVSFLLVMGCLLIPSKIQGVIPSGWQSTTNLSSDGLQFSPVDEQALFLFNFTASSLFACTRLCHSNGRCRIFDFDGQSKRCRLFEGNIMTMGSYIPSSSFQSRVGSMKLRSEQFTSRGQPCSSCQGSRYLTCVNGTCQCQVNTYYDGEICQSKKLRGDSCNDSTECRNDLNYTCLPRMQCGREYCCHHFVVVLRVLNIFFLSLFSFISTGWCSSCWLR